MRPLPDLTAEVVGSGRALVRHGKAPQYVRMNGQMGSPVELTAEENAILQGAEGPGAALALDLVTKAARMLGARALVPITSAHVDGCLYHGTSGTLYCEKLVSAGARVCVPTTTNVGALNLLNPTQSRLRGEARQMAYRLMVAHERMGCRPSWTCAPYQAGARPALGAQVAWGESNAVAFCNTVLGARTNRYGDFLDIACAIAGRAPACGLHLSRNRYARRVIDVSSVPADWQSDAVFYPVLGALVGQIAGNDVAAVTGLLPGPDEDCLKAFCAAAAATGAVGLVHLVGITPEASDLEQATGGADLNDVLTVTPKMLKAAYTGLSRDASGQVDAIALGSPHFSTDECLRLLELGGGADFAVPVYVCIGRHTEEALKAGGTYDRLVACGVRFVLDTCVVVTPILPEAGGVLMTNSAKFAHYATANTGYIPVFGSLEDCVETAQRGAVVRNIERWQ